MRSLIREPEFLSHQNGTQVRAVFLRPIPGDPPHVPFLGSSSSSSSSWWASRRKAPTSPRPARWVGVHYSPNLSPASSRRASCRSASCRRSTRRRGSPSTRCPSPAARRALTASGSSRTSSRASGNGSRKCAQAPPLLGGRGRRQPASRRSAARRHRGSSSGRQGRRLPFSTSLTRRAVARTELLLLSMTEVTRPRGASLRQGRRILAPLRWPLPAEAPCLPSKGRTSSSRRRSRIVLRRRCGVDALPWQRRSQTRRSAGESQPDGTLPKSATQR